MTETRTTRLTATTLVAAGLLGTCVVLAGGLTGEPGTAAFPASVVAGIIVLVVNRPKNDHRGRR